MSWFASELSDFDFKFFNFERGSPDGQQCWEALAASVALRLWKSRWRSQRVRLNVRGDSVAMLTLLIKFKAPARSRSLGVIAREIALDVAEAAYAPDVTVHIPGIANKTADVLPRLSSPSTPGVPPPEVPDRLRTVPQALPGARSERYFSSLTPGERVSGSDKSSGWQ